MRLFCAHREQLLAVNEPRVTQKLDFHWLLYTEGWRYGGSAESHSQVGLTSARTFVATRTECGKFAESEMMPSLSRITIDTTELP